MQVVIEAAEVDLSPEFLATVVRERSEIMARMLYQLIYEGKSRLDGEYLRPGYLVPRLPGSRITG